VIDPLDLPPYLRIPQEVRDAAWTGKKIARKVKESKKISRRPKSIEPAGLKLEREIAAEKKAKQKARLAALKKRKK